MYVIGNVIWGVPLSDKIQRVARTLGDAEGIDPRDPGSYEFVELYSGNADGPQGYCGVLLGRISEGSEVRVSDLPKPTPSQVALAAQLRTLVPLSIQEVMPEPDVWIVWSTS